MKHLAKTYCRLLATVGALSFTHFAQAAVFTNGSFEINGGPFSMTAPPWIVSGNLDFQNDQGATDGTFAAVFNAGQSTPNGVLSQTFDTIALQVYTVTFDWGTVFADLMQRLQIEVRNGATQLINPGSGMVTTISGATIIQNTNIFQIEDSTGAPPTNGPAPNAEFSLFSFTFTAQSSSSTIIFTDISPGAALNSDHVLDNVRLVPEPSTFAMIAVGGAILLGAVRFRRQLG